MTDIKNRGLKKRQSYDEIVDYLNNKQEKIKYPNRLAKQLRNSNQLSNLLDGDGQGLINMELQQQNIIKEQQKDIAINAMTDAKSTAKVLNLVASSTQTKVLKQSEARTQTANPKFKEANIQTANPKFKEANIQTTNSKVTTKGIQTQYSPSPLMYDIALDDRVNQLANDIEMASLNQSDQVKKRKAKIVNLLQAHLEDVSPSPMDVAHVMASSSNAASSNYMPPNMVGIQLNEPITNMEGIQLNETPETTNEPKGRRGRPRKVQQTESEQMLIDKELKRPSTPGESPIKKKSRKQQRLEALNNAEPESTEAQEEQPPASSSFSKGVKKAITKENDKYKILPSKMTIQPLREILEDAKNKQMLSTDDASAYTEMFNAWKGAKGDTKLKKQMIVGMREIYKRVLYKK